MAEKTLNTRIIHKHDTAEHWESAINFIPKKGEIIVYDIDENYSYERFKIGDEITNVNALPFNGEWNENVQSDWNENDETSDAYILNRTHYETKEYVEILPSQEFAFTESNGNYSTQIAYENNISIGDLILINWDGVEYECIAEEFPEGVVFGNLSLVSMGEDTGEPFVAIVPEGIGFMFGTEETEASHIISVAIEQAIVKKIDNKFLPEEEKVKIIYNSETDTYTSSITFEEAWAMKATALKRKLALYDYEEDNRPQTCSICSFATTRTMGEHIVLIFKPYFSLSSREIDVYPETILVWQPDGIHVGSKPEDASLLYTEQTLNEEQQTQARINIGAVGESEVQSKIDEATSALVKSVNNILPDENGNVELEIATDDDILALMMEVDAFPVVMDESGAIMTDEEGAILLA